VSGFTVGLGLAGAWLRVIRNTLADNVLKKMTEVFSEVANYVAQGPGASKQWRH
jgi:hypothetical protein